MNDVKLELFDVVPDFNFDRWCFLGYGSINQWATINGFQHERKDVVANGKLLSKNHRMVNAISVGA